MLSQAAIDDHAKRIAEDGYSVVEGALAPEFVAELRQDLERLERELKIQPAGNVFEGAKTLRIYNLLIHGKLWEQVPVHENVLPVVERVLDPGCLVSSLSSIKILPGEVAQPLHADDQLIPVPKPHVPLVCNTMWALSDFTAENGATRVVRGSHLKDRSPHPFNEEGAQPSVMSAGSVMIYHGSLWHGGGENRTEGERIGVAMNYCAGYIRQQENQQLGIPRQIAQRFSPRLKELVGYGVYNNLIGHIDKQSPLALLEEEVDASMIWDQASRS